MYLPEPWASPRGQWKPQAGLRGATPTPPRLMLPGLEHPLFPPGPGGRCDAPRKAGQEGLRPELPGAPESGKVPHPWSVSCATGQGPLQGKGCVGFKDAVLGSRAQSTPPHPILSPSVSPLLSPTCTFQSPLPLGQWAHWPSSSPNTMAAPQCPHCLLLRATEVPAGGPADRWAPPGSQGVRGK